MPIIEVKDLSYRYPNSDNPALDKINLSIEKGEFILLTGPSGCGKTTFSRCLNGLIPKFYNGEMTGSVTVNGMDTMDHPTYDLAKSVGLIFQNPDNQIFALTLEKDIAFGLENQGIPREEMMKEIEWATKVTGIDHLRQRATHELSGGQKQRLTIASVLAMHPDVIVMDEPTAFLDPVGAEQIFAVLDMLNKELGMTIILVEHRMDLAVKYVDRIIVFNEGRIADDGPTTEVFTKDATRLIGVGIPRVIQLSRLLRKNGLKIDGTPLSALDLFKSIEPYLPAKRKPSAAPGLDLDDFVSEYNHVPVLEVKNVEFTYSGGVTALNGVDLTINKGEYVAIMGENGAGKTTLVKHFNGLLRPNSGTVTVNGKESKEYTIAQLSQNVGLVFQNPDDQLFEETVEKEIGFALRNFGYSEDVVNKRVDWALNLLDLAEYREKSPFNLSGGERKRVALASVLAWDPEILVLDEPTVGQDEGQKEKLRHFLTQLRTQGKTVVIVTHDVEFVAESGPRIVLMADGKIVADGSAKTIMNQRDALSMTNVAQPEITRLFNLLEPYGFMKDVLDVNEAYDILSRKLRRSDDESS